MSTTTPALPVDRKLRIPATLVAAVLAALGAVALVGAVGYIGSSDDVVRSTAASGVIQTADAEARRAQSVGHGSSDVLRVGSADAAARRAQSVDHGSSDVVRVGSADAAERWNDR